MLRQFFVVALIWVLAALQVQAVEIRAAVLRVDYPSTLPISRLDYPVEDLGHAGGEVATQDNQTTGTFMGMSYVTDYVSSAPEDADAALDALLLDGVSLIVLVANAEDTLRLADRAGPDRLVLNAGARETALRDTQCRSNMLHVSPSHAMLADGAAQFAVWKKWTDWMLIHGSNPGDKLLAEAYRRAARKFGARIVEEREFEDTGGSRRSDSGHVMVQRQLPVFTQRAEDHDVKIAADASELFAHYLPYHSWDPRPVLGSGGLRPVSFHAANEAFGASQFHTRFEKLAGRMVREMDFDVWMALRAIGEAATRTQSGDAAKLRAYMLSDAFNLASFRGGAVSFRNWNGQMRQPVLLTDSHTMVSISPQDGFLHQSSPLDTLGLDRPESKCTAF